MKYLEQPELLLTKEQKSAVKNLEKAFKRCKKVDLYFHNINGQLIAYNGNSVKEVNDTTSNIHRNDLGDILTIPYDLGSWSDDDTFIHLTDKAKERLSEK